MGQMQEGLYVGSLACTSAIPSGQSTLPSTLPRFCVLADIEGMGDSLDLVPIGGWRGQGRKKRWVSPWLMATYDARTGTFGSVCRVMSGFTDAFYKENTIKYLGSEILPEIGAEGSGGQVSGGGEEEEGAEERQEEDEEEEEDVEPEVLPEEAVAAMAGGEDGASGSSAVAGGEDGTSGSSASLLLRGPAEGVETGENAQYWFQPFEVWEVRGADITLSPVHMAAAGLVAERGLSMRFPRFIRKRPDKRLSDATTPEMLAAMFRKQTQGQADE